MKRFVLALFAMLMMVAVYADNPIEITLGSKGFLKDYASANVEIDFSKTIYKEKELLMESLTEEEFERYTSKAIGAFAEAFNHNSKRLKIDNSEDARYAIDIEVDKIDYFFSVMSLVPGHKHTFFGTITVTNLDTAEIVCEMIVTRLKGGRDFSLEDSFYKCFAELGKELAKL
ncbi:MAG: hypothetical protein J5506_06685 [Prevotella sp.]|nr:hypothetical protein [Prevotella sp.]